MNNLRGREVCSLERIDQGLATNFRVQEGKIV